MFRGPLRGRVKQGSCHRIGADDRAEIDDAPALGTKALDRLLHHENRLEHVDVVVNVKALLADLRESAEAKEPGVVDQHVESTEDGVDFFEEPGDICGFGHVGPDGNLLTPAADDSLSHPFGAFPVRGVVTATRAPAAASASAIPLPMPLEAPVTIATLSVRLGMFIILRDRNEAVRGAAYNEQS